MRAHKPQLLRALDDVRVSRRPAEIWPEVQRFLHERGYPLLGDTRTRVRVEASPVAGGGSRLRVRLVKQVDMSLLDTTELRDVDLEVALLERLDPAAAARITGRQLPVAPAATPRGDPWARVRPLLGSWSGELADGTPVRWRFDLAGGGRLLEMRGTPLLFAGPAARGDGEELGRISRAADGDGLVWNQLTNAGRVDRYESAATPGSTPTADASLVFVAQAPESLPAGAHARLTLRRSGDQLEAVLDIAEPGKDLAGASAVRVTRAP